MSLFTWKSCTLVDHFLPPRRARFLQEKELAQKQSQSTKFEVDNNEKNVDSCESERHLSSLIIQSISDAFSSALLQ